MKMHELKRIDYDVLAEREVPRPFSGMDNVTCDTVMQGRIKGGATGAIAPGPPSEGAPRDENVCFK